MSVKRETARQWSLNGRIDAFGINQVYFALRDAVRVEQEGLPKRVKVASLPELGGLVGFRVRRRARLLAASGPLPHPADIQAVLTHAVASLHALAHEHHGLRVIERALTRHLLDCANLNRAFHYARRGRGAPRYQERLRGALLRALAVLERSRYSKRSELRYIRLALRRHLELGLTLNQAFGYARATRGPAPHPEEREQRIACTVFVWRFLKGLKAEAAGYKAGEQHDVRKTQALEAFHKHAYFALNTFKFERLRKAHPQLIERHTRGEALTADERQILEKSRLWTAAEERRLKRYYEPLQKKRVKALLDPQPTK